MLEQTQIQWQMLSNYRYTPTFFKYSAFHLYRHHEGELSEFHLKRGALPRFQAFNINVPSQCDIIFEPASFTPVDVHTQNQAF